MRRFFWPAFGVLILGMIAARIALTNTTLRMNESKSEPLGIYRTTPNNGPLANGDYVGICLPSSILQLAQGYGYILRAGECSDGHQAILKTVFRATPADPIAFLSEGFCVHSRVLPNTRAKAYSQTGKSLVHWPYGTYTSGIWAISTYSPDSFDSRYFGPLNDRDIRFRAKPVMTF